MPQRHAGWADLTQPDEGKRKSGAWESGLFLPPFLFLAPFFPLSQNQKGFEFWSRTPKTRGSGKATESGSCGPCCLPGAPSKGAARRPQWQRPRSCPLGVGTLRDLSLFKEAETWSALLTDPFPGAGRPQLTKEQDEMLKRAGPRFLPTALSPMPPPSPPHFVVTSEPLTVTLVSQEE